jgi:hypothetical protein
LNHGLLTNEDWASFEPFMVAVGPLGGPPPRDHRRNLDAILSRCSRKIQHSGDRSLYALRTRVECSSTG